MPESKEQPQKVITKWFASARAPKQREAFEVPGQGIALAPDEEKLVITTTGFKAVQSKAAEMAEREMQKKPGEKGVASIVKTIWKRSLLSEYFREREFQFSKELLGAVNNDVLADDVINKAKSDAKTHYQNELKSAGTAKQIGRKALEFLKSATGRKTRIQQLTLDELSNRKDKTISAAMTREISAANARFHEALNKNDDMIRTEMGEQMRVLDEAKPEEKAIIDEGHSLMLDLFDGLPDADFQTRSRKLWDNMKKLEPKVFNTADLYISSLFETVQGLKVQKDHGISMDVIRARIMTSEFRLGFGILGAATSVDASDTRRIMAGIDRVVSRFEKNPLGAAIFNEAVIGSATALVISGTLRVPQQVATNAARAAAGLVGGGAVGGLVAGTREYRRLGRERKVHLSEKESGYQLPQEGSRKWMEQFAIEQTSANDLKNAVGQSIDSLADAQAKINISSRRDNRIGLVRFSSPQTMESERTDLYRAIRDAKANLSIEDRKLLDEKVQKQTDKLNDAMKEATGRFNKARTVRAVKYGATAAGAGILVGAATHGIQGATEQLSYHAKVTAAAPEKVAETLNKAVGEMGKSHGMRGPWGWFEEPMQDKANAIFHQVPATNLVKNLFRGWEENVQGKHVDYTRLSNSFVFKDLPKGLFGDETLPKIGHIMDEAIKMREIDHIALDKMDELHRLAYEIGRVSRIPSKDEVYKFMEFLSPAKPPVEGANIVEQIIQSPSPVIAPAVSIHPPLEGFIAAAAPSGTTEQAKLPERPTPTRLLSPGTLRLSSGPLRLSPGAPPPPPKRRETTTPPVIILGSPPERTEEPIVEVLSTQAFPKADEYEKMLKRKSREILGTIRWKLNNDDKIAKRESRHFDPKKTLDMLIRGNMAEQYSEILPVSGGKTVFSVGGNTSDIALATFQREFGVSIKHKILEKAVRKSFIDKPIKLQNISGEVTEADIKALEERIVQAYSSKPEESLSAGILYEESIIPDGVLKNGQGEIVGFSEVKAYLPEEFDGLIEKLPDQLSNEITFIDNIRTVGFGNEALRDDMPILLRFPSDIPDASLQLLGQRLQEQGFTNVLIQKIPLTSTQITQESKKFVQNNLEQIKNGTIKMEQEGIELFEWYAQQPETLATTIPTPMPPTPEGPQEPEASDDFDLEDFSEATPPPVETPETLATTRPAPMLEIQNEQNVTNYQQYIQEHPLRLLDTRIDQSNLERTELNTQNNEFAERIIDNAHNLGIITGVAKAEDAIGIRDSSKILFFAVADGVSRTICPKVASRVAVETSLLQMQQDKPLSDIFPMVQNNLSGINIQEMAQKEIDALIAKVKQAQQSPPTQTSPQPSGPVTSYRELNSDSMNLDRLLRLQNENALASTTLALARYTKETGRVELALKGDTSAMVIRADGTMHVHKNTNNSSQIHYYPTQQPYEYKQGAEQFKEIVLQPNDILVVFTDGVDRLRSPFESIVKTAIEKISPISHRYNGLTQAIYNKIVENGELDDDVSVVILQHTIEGKTEEKPAAPTQAQQPTPTPPSTQPTASTPEAQPSILLPSGQQIIDFIGDRESNFDGVYQDRLRDVAGQLTIQASVETQRRILTQTSRTLGQMEQDFLKAKGSWGKLNVGYAKQLRNMIDRALDELPLPPGTTRTKNL